MGGGEIVWGGICPTPPLSVQRLMGIHRNGLFIIIIQKISAFHQTIRHSVKFNSTWW